MILRALYHQDSGDFAGQIRECQGRILRMAERRIWSLFNLPMAWKMRQPRYARTMKFLNELTYRLIDNRRHDKSYPEGNDRECDQLGHVRTRPSHRNTQEAGG